jgi:hypothetical protein
LVIEYCRHLKRSTTSHQKQKTILQETNGIINHYINETTEPHPLTTSIQALGRPGGYWVGACGESIANKKHFEKIKKSKKYCMCAIWI